VGWLAGWLAFSTHHGIIGATVIVWTLVTLFALKRPFFWMIPVLGYCAYALGGTFQVITIWFLGLGLITWAVYGIADSR
jgi:hypothetical protein